MADDGMQAALASGVDATIAGAGYVKLLVRLAPGAAVEAMAAGRVVMGYVGEETLAELPDAPPIVQAPPGDFASALEAILEDRAAGRDRGAQGVAYARRQHDGRAAAEVLGGYLTSGDAG